MSHAWHKFQKILSKKIFNILVEPLFFPIFKKATCVHCPNCGEYTIPFAIPAKLRLPALAKSNPFF